MVRTRWILAVVCGFTARAAVCDDYANSRHAARAPYPKIPIVQSMERAGNSQSLARFLQPSVGPHEAGGYVGGGSLKGNHPLSKHSGGYGPVHEGTFGWDFVGFGGRIGRVFLASSPAKKERKAPDFNSGYRTDGPHVSDVFTHRPIRKSVIQAHEDNPKHGAPGRE